jgi:hypothetical protein
MSTGSYRLIVLLKGIVIRVCASPHTGWARIQAASKGMRTAVGYNSWGLIGHPFGWIHGLDLQPDLFFDVLAVTHFDDFPRFLSHKTPPSVFSTIILQKRPSNVYKISVH